MKTWQASLERMLSAHQAPPALTRDLLSRFARNARDGSPTPSSTLTYWVKEALAHQKLLLILRGIYLNQFRPQPGTLADATPLLRRDAVVSLHTVLGDAGVLNNPSRIITAVVPFDPGHPPPRLGTQHTHAGRFHFFGLPRRILIAGSPEQRLDTSPHHEHPRATPEKALIDWIYLANSPRSRLPPPPPHDIDIDTLDRSTLMAIAEEAKLRPQLTNWLQRT